MMPPGLFRRNGSTAGQARGYERHAILSTDVTEAIEGPSAEIIEECPTDPRGHSCLVYGLASSGRIPHIVMSVDAEWVITVYRPRETEPGTSESCPRTTVPAATIAAASATPAATAVATATP